MTTMPTSSTYTRATAAGMCVLQVPPHTQHLAEQGVVFRQAFSAVVECLRVEAKHRCRGGRPSEAVVMALVAAFPPRSTQPDLAARMPPRMSVNGSRNLTPIDARRPSTRGQFSGAVDIGHDRLLAQVMGLRSLRNKVAPVRTGPCSPRSGPRMVIDVGDLASGDRGVAGLFSQP